jgi:hypothetical protein
MSASSRGTLTPSEEVFMEAGAAQLDREWLRVTAPNLHQPAAGVAV